MTTTFTATDGQITSPNGTPFLARGIGVLDGTINSQAASQILSDFPGINMVRLAIESLQAPLSSTIQGFIQQMTSAGVVDEVALWGVATNSGNFTPNSSAYHGYEPGLFAVWHLDNSSDTWGYG